MPEPQPKETGVNGQNSLFEEPDADTNGVQSGTREPSVDAKETLEDPHQSSSEMSVLDESFPPPKRQLKKAVSKKDVKSESKRGRPPSAESKAPFADEEEIKRLQKQLLQCGVRKLWGKELKPYESSKAKIKHLKGMLRDVGITGRFSAEKAREIKEARELQADLEDLNERDKKWGMNRSSDDDKGAQRRKRAVPKSLQDLDMFDDEESD